MAELCGRKEAVVWFRFYGSSGRKYLSEYRFSFVGGACII